MIGNYYGNPNDSMSIAMQKLRDAANEDEQNKLFNLQRSNVRSDALNNGLALLKSARTAGAKTGSSSVKSGMGVKALSGANDQTLNAMNNLAAVQGEQGMQNRMNVMNAAANIGQTTQGMNLNEDVWTQKLKEYQDALNQRYENRQWQTEDMATELANQKDLMKFQKDLNKVPWWKKMLGGLFSTGGDVASSWAKGGFK